MKFSVLWDVSCWSLAHRCNRRVNYSRRGENFLFRGIKHLILQNLSLLLWAYSIMPPPFNLLYRVENLLRYFKISADIQKFWSPLGESNNWPSKFKVGFLCYVFSESKIFNPQNSCLQQKISLDNTRQQYRFDNEWIGTTDWKQLGMKWNVLIHSG
jgi:hypothetical protein